MDIPSEFVAKLVAHFSLHSSSENAIPMTAYLKHRFEFLGIKTPLRRELSKNFLFENGLPNFEDVEDIIFELFSRDEREFHHFAIELPAKYLGKWDSSILGLFEEMATTKSWWDSVDGINSLCLKPYFKQFSETRNAATNRWIESRNLWLQRLSIICQIGFREQTDVELLFDNIARMSESREFFIQKAIGWSLRELAKSKPKMVLDFVNESDLSPLSSREALRHLIKRK